MKFNDRARLDTSQVQDRRGSGRGRSGGGIGGLPVGRGGLAAGGGLGILVVLAVVLFSALSGGSDTTGSGAGAGDPGGLGGLGGLGALQPGDSVTTDDLAQRCRTGVDANTDADCAAVAVVNSVQAYWQDALATSGTTYQPADTVFYSGSTQTGGCGVGQSGMGPFYCPADGTVYLDLSFWNDLRTQFGADSGPFTQAYVLAHEYGHHVQDLLGTSDRIGTATGPTSGSVRLELQADCYAGVWADHAQTVPGADGEVLISGITAADVDAAVDTAGRIGDDAIMARAGRPADPSSFSHGTAAQRQQWFTTGMDTGDPAACDTFGADDLG
jgi:predicted metalloprotease